MGLESENISIRKTFLKAMRKIPVSPLRNQDREKVKAYFQSRSSFWQNVYSGEDTFAEIIRDRHAAVLAWVDSLILAPDSRILEVGCGAGFLSVALAQCGFRIQAVDSVEAMVELAQQHAAESGTTHRLSVDVGDVYSLAFENDSFDLVIAVGVLPWLERVDQAIEEMARVTKPNGSIILTTANPLGLPYLLDPSTNPVLQPLKKGVKNVLKRVGLYQKVPGMTFHGSHFMKKALSRAKLVKIRDMTLGFEFSFFRHKAVPEPLATMLHQRLQYLVGRNMPGFRSLGMSYHILAQKSAPVEK